MYFYDVKQDYFDGWRENLHPIYRAEGGRILDYNECKLDVLYTKPLYTAKQKKYISYDAQRYLMYSTDDYEKVTHQLQLMKRKIAVVRQFLKLNVKIQCISLV